MPFNSLSYFLFLPVVFLTFYFTRDTFRWLVLLVASYLFYAALGQIHLILALLLVTVLSYGFGIWIDRSSDPQRKRHLLWAGISAAALVLISLKYLPLFVQDLNYLLRLAAPQAAIPVNEVIVSIGVSYFVFQGISYLIDIYLEIVPPERHFGYFALHMAFFPKLLQGPIERGGALLPQLRQPGAFSYESARSGLLLFGFGLFKKVVIADRLAFYVNPVYDNVHDYSGLVLILATYMYAFQIYFDFSGYTDMALGTARLFNIQLTQNFNRPYLATSVADFWRRWHISFSRWILDYIFKPLQMGWRNAGQMGTAGALLITFVISGIWHGASWGFVVWGVLHGIYLAASTYYRPYQKKLHRWLGIEKNRWLKVWQVLITFNLVSFAWIFFRCNTFSDALYILRHCFSGPGAMRTLLISQGKGEIWVLALLMVVAAFYGKHIAALVNKRLWVRWCAYYALVTMIVYLSSANSNFIYFKF